MPGRCAPQEEPMRRILVLCLAAAALAATAASSPAGSVKRPTFAPGFGDRGLVVFGKEGADFSDQAVDVDEDRQGRILVISYASAFGDPVRSANLLTRFTASGERDTTFGVGGHLDLDALGGARAMAVDSQGRIVLRLDDEDDPRILRLTESGEPD